jgi:hypothetical protein
MIQELKSSGVVFLEVQDADVWKSNAVSLYGEFAPGWEDLIKDIQSYKY